MIFVSRGKPPRAFLADAAQERLRFKAHTGPGAFKFRAYRNKDAVSVLEKLFHSKCAYCEWGYAAGSYVEIEHYRPKSHYYWLAAEWSNLLPSCKKCNNGKLSKFPLVDPKKKASRKGEERRETPLLLNPSNPRIKPEFHLVFDSRDGAVSAALDKSGKTSAIGVESIKVYRLHRLELAQERKKWAQRLLRQIERCRLAAASRRRAILLQEYEDLKDLLLPTQPFCGLSRQVMKGAGFGRA